ncbi:MAG: Gfo/Idh/MocA family protein, partial [Halanaerobiaceae bacterium]
MVEEIKIGMIGLDTSHAVEFPRRMQAPDCPEDQKVEGMKVKTCLRFETPFQDKEGLDERQAQLEEWGVKVTEEFSEVVKDIDAIMLEINDPAYHLEYFEKCVDLNKPVFLDKPLADNIENGKKIVELAKENNIRLFSSSSLRFVPQLDESLAEINDPLYGYSYGPLGEAPAGSNIVWYGVHAFEMLERAMGTGAKNVYTKEDKAGVVVAIEYPEKRRGIVELTRGAYVYGGCLRTNEKAAPFVVNTSRIYTDQLKEIASFFRGNNPPLELEDTLEIMKLLDAAERSLQTG